MKKIFFIMLLIMSNHFFAMNFFKNCARAICCCDSSPRPASVQRYREREFVVHTHLHFNRQDGLPRGFVVPVLVHSVGPSPQGSRVELQMRVAAGQQAEPLQQDVTMPVLVQEDNSSSRNSLFEQESGVPPVDQPGAVPVERSEGELKQVAAQQAKRRKESIYFKENVRLGHVRGFSGTYRRHSDLLPHVGVSPTDIARERDRVRQLQTAMSAASVPKEGNPLRRPSVSNIRAVALQQEGEVVPSLRTGVRKEYWKHLRVVSSPVVRDIKSPVPLQQRME